MSVTPAPMPTPTSIPVAPVVRVAPQQPVQESTILRLINQDREQAGVGDLREDNRLDVSATKKACDMRDRNYWSHQDPEGRYSWYMFNEAGYFYTYAAENLARGYTFDQDAVNAWLASPEHRENMLNPLYHDLGVGHCGIYTVTHFGSD